MSPRAHISYAWQLIGRVGIFDTEARGELLGLLIEIFAEELVQLTIVAACGHVKPTIPLGCCIRRAHTTITFLVIPDYDCPFPH